MKKPVVDYRTFRLRKINEPQFSHLKLLLGCLTNATLRTSALHCIKMCSICQTNIIRTRFSPWEMGSDYLFISRDTNKSISPMAHPFGQIPNREGHAKRRLHKQRGQPQRLPSFSLYSVRPAVLASVQILLALPGQHMRPVYHQTRSERTAQRHTAEHRSY